MSSLFNTVPLLNMEIYFNCNSMKFIKILSHFHPIKSCSRSNSPILEKESAMSNDSDIDIVEPTSPGANESMRNEVSYQYIRNIEVIIVCLIDFGAYFCSTSSKKSSDDPLGCLRSGQNEDLFQINQN